MAKAEEFRNEITNKIITALENGTAPWQQPWNGAEGPHNAVTHRQYSGINNVILSMASMSFNASKAGANGKNCKTGIDMKFITFKQAQENNWHVKKGDRGTHVLLWKPTMGTDENGKQGITSVLQRVFTVFHASQIIESWLKSLRNDNMYIFRTAAEASKAAEFLLKNAGQDSCESDE